MNTTLPPPKTILIARPYQYNPSRNMTPANDESSQRKASSHLTGEPIPTAIAKAGEPTPTTAIWLCPDVLNTIEQARTLFLYKPPDAKHGYTERIKSSCGRPL